MQISLFFVSSLCCFQAVKCVGQCASKNVETVIDLIKMEDDERRSLLDMPDRQLHDVTMVCNRYPDIQLNFEVVDSDSIIAGEQVTIMVALERDYEGELRPVDAPR